MKIIATEGCTCFDLTIDGDSTMIDLRFSEEKECKERLPKLQEAFFKVIDYVSINFEYQSIFSIFEDIMEMLGLSDKDYVFKLEPYELDYSNNYDLLSIKKNDKKITKEDITAQSIKDIISNCPKDMSIDSFYGYLQSLLHQVVCVYGEGKYIFHCDQCGDNVYDYKIEV